VATIGPEVVITGALGVVGAIVAAVTGHRPQKADYADRLVDASVKATDLLSSQLARLSRRLDEAEAEVQECEARNRQMQQDINRLNAIVGAMTRHLASLGIPPPTEDA
jgi:septal ring factor EnvC (AmiA/AmiB activator)